MTSNWWKPKFSLRALFVITAIIAVWLCIESNQARRQKAAVQAVIASGGRVVYDHEREQSPPAGPRWLRRWIGDEYFQEVVEVNWVGVKDLAADDLKWLPDFPQLDSVNLNFSNVNDDGLAHLGDVSSLKKIRLEMCAGVTDVGLSHLAPHEALEQLSLLATGCTDQGIRNYVPGFSKLTYLDVAGVPISNETAMKLGSLKHLKMVHLSRLGHRAAHDLSSAVASIKQRLPNCRINYWGPETADAE